MPTRTWRAEQNKHIALMQSAPPERLGSEFGAPLPLASRDGCHLRELSLICVEQLNCPRKGIGGEPGRHPRCSRASSRRGPPPPLALLRTGSATALRTCSSCFFSTSTLVHSVGSCVDVDALPSAAVKRPAQSALLIRLEESYPPEGGMAALRLPPPRRPLSTSESELGSKSFKPLGVAADAAPESAYSRCSSSSDAIGFAFDNDPESKGCDEPTFSSATSS